MIGALGSLTPSGFPAKAGLAEASYSSGELSG